MSTDCGCAAATTPRPPTTVTNRAGLREIAYRSGTWARFRESMLDALSTSPELGGLRTRSDDDFTIALLDAWAVVCDILTFYQERIANESYLRTATETVSVGELAKLIGYKLRPGLAAAAALAFTLDVPLPIPVGPNTPPSGLPAQVVVPVGTKAQTIPDPGAQPATFETVAAVTARPSWNAIGLRVRRPMVGGWWAAYMRLRVVGTAPPVQVGDQVLVGGTAASSWWLLRRVSALQVDQVTQTTVLRFADDFDAFPAALPTAPGSADDTAVLGDDFVRSAVRDHVWADQTDLVAYAQRRGWSVDELEAQINALRGVATTTPDVAVLPLGIRAAIFGNNAPDWNSVPSTVQAVYGNWNSEYLSDTSADGASIDLDGVYPVAQGAALVLTDTASGADARTVATSVTEVNESRFLLTGKATRVHLGSFPSPTSSWHMRTTRVLAQTAALQLADLVDENPVTGGSFTLGGAYLGLGVGQQLAVTGKRTDRSGATTSEVVTITGLSLVDGYTQVSVSPGLAGSYTPTSVTVNANVAPATHGETVSEILGSGDATMPFQRFVLKQPPLTYVSAATASGSASTLVVRVDGVRWTQVDWLSGAGATDRVYTVVAAVDGRTYVQFGDGVTGARPGSGSNNVVATYRHGTGSAGLARAGQLSTLLTRPFGVSAVTNPAPATGAADPETLAAARTNAPITVLTLDRIVSLADVAAFAAANAGVAKAAVDWVWDGSRYVACATVSGPAGAAIPPGTGQHSNLLQAMRAAGDGTLAVALCSYVPVTFTVAASVQVDPALVSTDVLAAVKQALRTAFGFDSRGFGAPVFASEVVEVMQDVAGVVALTLDGLNYVGQPLKPAVAALTASRPTLGATGLIGAQLLTLDTGPLPYVVVTAS